MATSSQHARSKALNKLLAARLQDFEALSRAMENEVSPVTKARYKRKLSYLDEEIKKLDASIVELDQGKLILNWEKDLPEIDFRKAKAAFLEVQEQLGSEPGAALFSPPEK
jgi:Effector-associated domain 9